MKKMTRIIHAPLVGDYPWLVSSAVCPEWVRGFTAAGRRLSQLHHC